jgi:hypothetical protein
VIASRILDVALIVMKEVLNVTKKMCGGLPILSAGPHVVVYGL